MNNLQPYYLLGAEAYGVGNYACGDYQTGCAAGASTGSESGGLSYTGYNIIIPVALALSLIVAATILLVTKFIRKRKSVPSA